MITNGIRWFLFFLVLSLSTPLGFAQLVGSQAYAVELDLEHEVQVSSPMVVDATVLKNKRGQTYTVTIESLSSAWTIASERSITLFPFENKTIEIALKPDSAYFAAIKSPDFIKISQQPSALVGTYYVPVQISGDGEEVKATYKIKVVELGLDDQDFNVQLYDSNVAPFEPLVFSVTGENVTVPTTIKVIAEVNNEVIVQNVTLSPDLPARLVHVTLDNYPAGDHTVRFSVLREDAQNRVTTWAFSYPFAIDKVDNIVAEPVTTGDFLKEKVTYHIANKGNAACGFKEEINVGFFSSFVLEIDGLTPEQYELQGSHLTIYRPLAVGEESSFTLRYNYYLLYLTGLLALIAGAFAYMRIKERINPVLINSAIENIKIDAQDNVISKFDVRVSFENKKDIKLKHLNLFIKVPSFLTVVHDSFTLSEPTKVYKTASHFIFKWNFKNFDPQDSRIIGFTLVNKKKIILRDLKLPPLEIHVGKGDKEHVYKKKFPHIRW